MQCVSCCTGESYDLPLISDLFTNIGWAHRIYGKDVLYLESSAENDEDVFIFNYGCVVIWSKESFSENRILDKIKGFLNNPLKEAIDDRCNFKIRPDEESGIDEENDTIIIDSDDPNIKLSFSYGLSQSVKLSVFEDAVEQTIDQNKSIPSELIKTGKISFSKRELSKKIGVLFAERNYINLNSDILDTPDFFWRRPKYETYYEMSVDFMDLNQRLDILNTRLDIIHELYGILSAELQHIHSSRLEMIIIFLILIEVLMGVTLFIIRDLLHLI